MKLNQDNDQRSKPTPEMYFQDEKAQTFEVSDKTYQDEVSVIDLIAKALPPAFSATRIHRFPRMVEEPEEYEKYYVPKVVSIGPYHFGNPKLKMVEELKPYCTKKLFSDDMNALENLYKKLGEEEMVKELRNYYEEKSTDQFCDKVFTKMMLLDGCFILYYIKFIYGEKFDPEELKLKGNQIVFIHTDLFLLENQIPFRVLKKVMDLMNDDAFYKKISVFIDENILARERPNKRRWICFRNDQSSGEEATIMQLKKKNSYHLLQLLHQSLTKRHETPENDFKQTMMNRCTNFIGGICFVSRNYGSTFRNVNELMDVGIDFKPSGTMSLAHIWYFKSWWLFSAHVELPPIIVDDSTKLMLLNLVAYETCSCYGKDSWVTSYICLLNSLIARPEDVKTLTKAGLLKINTLGSDKDVAELFHEIGTDLVPYSFAYLHAKKEIQRHYEAYNNTLYSKLRKYCTNNFDILAILGVLAALFLSGVQAYFTIWSPKNQCDDLCMLLKTNHHL